MFLVRALHHVGVTTGGDRARPRRAQPLHDELGVDPKERLHKIYKMLASGKTPTRVTAWAQSADRRTRRAVLQIATSPWADYPDGQIVVEGQTGIRESSLLAVARLAAAAASSATTLAGRGTRRGPRWPPGPRRCRAGRYPEIVLVERLARLVLQPNYDE